MIEESKVINSSGTTTLSFFLANPLVTDTTISTLDIIFPENRIADVVQIKPLIIVQLSAGKDLLLDEMFNKASTTHKVGFYQIKIKEHLCKKDDRLWLNLKFTNPPTISQHLSVLARLS